MAASANNKGRVKVPSMTGAASGSIQAPQQSGIAGKKDTMEINVIDAKGGNTTVAAPDVTVSFGVTLRRGDVEAALGRKLNDGDVVGATVNGQTYRCTISKRPRSRRIGTLTGVNGRGVEHTLRIEDNEQ